MARNIFINIYLQVSGFLIIGFLVLVFGTIEKVDGTKLCVLHQTITRLASRN